MKLPIKNIANRFNVSERTVWQWIADGCPAVTPGNHSAFLDPVVVEAWKKANNRTGVPGRPRADGQPPGSDSLSDGTLSDTHREALAKAKLRKELALAAKHEHALAVSRGEYLPAAEVQKRDLEKILSVKAKLLSLPGKLAARLAMRSSEDVYAELRREVHDLLLDFSGGQIETPAPEEAVA